jgi:GNAT superfamily N-acetyltransferase
MPITVTSAADAAARGLVTVDGLVTLVNIAYHEAEVGLWHVSPDRTSPAEVAERLDRDEVLVALADERDAVGAIFTSTDDALGWFGALAVGAEAAGRGVGAALVQAAEARALGRGATAMQLEVLVPEPAHDHTTRLWHWYHRLGFVEVHRQPLASFEPDLGRQCARPCDLVTLRHTF